VLEHCREKETNFWLFFFRGVSSDCLPKATKDVTAHFFIHRFTVNDEFVMDDNAAAVKLSCKLYQ
jgi:hypothetical protein